MKGDSAERRAPWARALLTARTVAGLRPVQWIQLPISRLPSRRRPPPRVSATLDPDGMARLGTALDRAGPGDAGKRVARADRVLAGHLTLLGVDVPLAEVDWAGTTISPLWTYHLHYIEWALDLAWAFRLTGRGAYLDRLGVLLRAWDAGTRGRSCRAWEAYPLATRSLTLAALGALLADALPAELGAMVAGQLAGHCAVAESRLERHLQGNHLWRDIAGWVVAAHVLERERWTASRERATQWWDRVRREQLASDGVHEERSPLYHALALQDVALATVVLPDGPARDRSHADGRRMAAVLPYLLRPNGRPHLFSDSAARDDLDPAALRGLLSAVGLSASAPEGPFDLTGVGYAGVVSSAKDERLIVDCGRPAPRHQPGHLHCQLLSLEYDLRGQTILTNAGVSGYDADPLRGFFRGTSAHNTLQFGQHEQSEIWGTFRVGRMASVSKRDVGWMADGAWQVSAAVTHAAPLRTVHLRTITWRPGRLEVLDQVEGRGDGPARVFIHFMPTAAIRPVSPSDFDIEVGGVKARLALHGADRVDLIRGRSVPPQGWYAGRFGPAEAAICLEAVLPAGPRVSLRWALTEVLAE